MDIKKRKQKGSSLILVIMIFSVLTILGVSILSLTASAFKSRIVESAERRNQYFAESGIDIAYGEIGKVVDQGIKDGNQAVQTFMDGLDDILERERESVKNGGTSHYIKLDGTTDEVYISQMQNSTFQTSYKASVISSIGKWFSEGENKYIIPIPDSVFSSNKPKVIINANKDTIDFDKEIRYKGTTSSALTLNLSSDFKDNSMIKTISVNYNILLPNYKDIYYVETNKFKLPINAVWNKAFCIDGNLNVTGNLQVNGDVYVKGKDGNDSGINIKGSGVSTTFNGNVSSFGGVQVSNKNNSVTVNGNVYAGNMLINDEADLEGLTTKGASLTVNGAVYTNNDLAVNGERSIVNITSGFYGINDVNITDGINENQKPKVSSCLLVNSDDIGNGSNITIGTEAILMGTAYIRTIPSYQTGESVSIKGNYRAYMNPLNSDMAKYQTDENGNIKYEYETDANGDVIKDDNNKPILKKDDNGKSIPILRNNGGYKEDNVIFEYVDPLQLVTKFKNENEDELTWQDKSDYFDIYAKEYGSGSGLNLGSGITLPSNIIHIGAIVANGGTSTGNFTNDNISAVKDKQTSYATKIYAMDDPEGIDTDTAFAQNEVKRKIFSLSGDKVDTSISQIDFTKVAIDQLNTTSSGDIIYLNNSSKDCVLVGKNAVIDDAYKDSTTTTLINLQEGAGRGIILTRGNVYLAGEVNFKGTIISTENIETLDSSQKNLNYNSNYVQRLIAYNYNNYFQNVFIRNSSTNSQNIEVESNANKDNNAGTDVIRDKLIIMKNWKIIK